MVSHGGWYRNSKENGCFLLALANWKASLRSFLGCFDLRSFHRFASISNELVVNLSGLSRQVCCVITTWLLYASYIFGGVLDGTKSSVAILG